MGNYILFYSNNCKYSIKFIQILEGSGEIMYFDKICVDKIGRKHPFIERFGIKEVPSIIIDNKVLSDIPAFKWLENRLQTVNRVTAMPSRNNKTPNINATKANMDNGTEISAYNQGGMKNFTDNCISVNEDQSNCSIYTPEETNESVDRHNIINLPSNTINFDSPIDDKRLNVKTKHDSLKKKQVENEYQKMVNERMMN